MTQIIDETMDPAGLEGYRALRARLAEAARLYGAAPEAVEEKAALEARRAAEAIVVDGVLTSWTVSESSWTEGKMEAPGVQQWESRYVLKLNVSPAYAEDAFGQVREYWISRDFDLKYWNPAAGVSAEPARGSWTLAAGLIDETALFVRVESGTVQTSSNPLRNEEGS